jgi:cobalt-precorrin 5A hydrolase/precorrin-3B C17-methyltransferase
MALTPVVLALSAAGEATAHRLAGALALPLHGRQDRVTRADAWFPDDLTHLRDLFAAGHRVVAVCASGILIRTGDDPWL